MNKREHLLTLLAEECAELIKTATKSQRFGFEYVAPNGQTNHDNLVQEFHDLLAIVEILQEEDYIILPHHQKMDGMILDKKNKTTKYMNYSKELGYLND